MMEGVGMGGQALMLDLVLVESIQLLPKGFIDRHSDE